MLSGSDVMMLRLLWDPLSIYISGTVGKWHVIIKLPIKEETLIRIHHSFQILHETQF